MEQLPRLLHDDNFSHWTLFAAYVVSDAQLNELPSWSLYCQPANVIADCLDSCSIGCFFSHHIPVAGFGFVDPLSTLNFEQCPCTVEWEVIECGITNARARQAQIALCSNKPLQMTDDKACDINTAAKPKPVQIPASTPSGPIVVSSEGNSQKPEEQRFGIESINSVTATCTNKQWLRQKTKAAKSCVLKKLCCRTQVLD